MLYTLFCILFSILFKTTSSYSLAQMAAPKPGPEFLDKITSFAVVMESVFTLRFTQFSLLFFQNKFIIVITIQHQYLIF